METETKSKSGRKSSDRLRMEARIVELEGEVEYQIREVATLQALIELKKHTIAEFQALLKKEE